MKNTILAEVRKAFSALKSEKETELFLFDVMTPTELASIAERLQIFKMLKNGVPQRKISKTLKVSISKVIRGAHALKRSKGGISLILKRI